MKILFSMLSVVSIPKKQINTLVRSAKKHFLKNHDIEFVVFTDQKERPYIEDVSYIEIDNTYSKTIHYYQFQKLLSLNYINIEQYDYIFVNDIDQVYVNDVTDEDILTNTFSVVNHFYPFKMSNEIENWTDIFNHINTDFYYIMGTFFGGPKHIIKDFVTYTNHIWDKHKDYKYRDFDFFSKNPDEVIIGCFLAENNIGVTRLSSSIEHSRPAFLTNFEYLFNHQKNITNFKLVHNTKVLYWLVDYIESNVYGV